MATRSAPPTPELTPHTDAPTEGAPAPRCANCGTPAGDAFCPHCGQEQHDLHRSVRSLFAEALDSLAGWDGKIPTTLWLLVRHPGRLTTEFLAGRRARYLRPLRLYLTLSLVYFVALSFDWRPSGRTLNVQLSSADSIAAVRDSIAEARADSVTDARADSIAAAAVGRAAARRADTTTLERRLEGTFERRAQRFKALPKEERNRRFTTSFFGQLPNMVFALVPVFALLLRVAYRRAPLFYAEHLVHALHLHAFAMVALTVVHFTPGAWSLIPFLAIPAYAWLALRHVYGGSATRTTVKLGLVLGGYTIALVAAVSALAVAIVFSV
ncbi:DUF3667 domain-containing protein [Roseisolibacter agri]|uniref:DUF3667 domain-containing protein n=1 Tax=Roseisolibacter agri TaxID=2014610 RepID=A0AA37VBX7_9BACT|nr:DUF3667 domain-containing protein [Roseisolibacter agri]GLC27028.1 hypothetical protein rosag_35410 [Roseisolibacter agri]